MTQPDISNYHLQKVSYCEIYFYINLVNKHAQPDTRFTSSSVQISKRQSVFTQVKRFQCAMCSILASVRAVSGRPSSHICALLVPYSLNLRQIDDFHFFSKSTNNTTPVYPKSAVIAVFECTFCRHRIFCTFYISRFNYLFWKIII